MRELTINEMSLVGGGWVDPDILAAVTAVATGVGIGAAQWAGLTASQQMAVGAYFGVTGAALTASAAAGWGIGNWLNTNTPIQQWISDATTYLNPGDDGDGE